MHLPVRDDVGLKPDALVTTARLSLRLHRESDLERLVAIYSQPEVARFLSRSRGHSTQALRTLSAVSHGQAWTNRPGLSRLQLCTRGS